MKVKQNGMKNSLEVYVWMCRKKIALGVFYFIVDICLNVFWHFSIQFKSYVIDRCQIGVNANRLNVMF